MRGRALEDYLTTKEAAAALGVTCERVLQYARQDRLQHWRVGNRYLFCKEEVAEFRRNPPRRTGRPKKSL